MFGFLAHLARFKRGDASLLLVAALLALWTMPGATSAHALAPQGSHTQAILFLLASEASAPRTHHLGAPTHLETQASQNDEAPLPSNATAHCGAFRCAPSPQAPQSLRPNATHELSAHVVARLSGVHTNVRLN